MEKKYELIGEPNPAFATPLYRIRALRNFSDVYVGDVGGWVQGEHNLSQSGNCWVADDAFVCGDAIVRDSAVVKDHALVKDSAVVEEYAVVSGHARVRDNSRVKWHATVTDAALCDHATVAGRTHLTGGYIGGNALLTGGAAIDGSRDVITVMYRDAWYTMYPDRPGYDRCKQLYSAQIGGDGCITRYRSSFGDDIRIVYAAGDAKPNDHIVVEPVYAPHSPADVKGNPPMTQTAFAECNPDAYKALAGLAAILAENAAKPNLNEDPLHEWQIWLETTQID